MLLKQFILSITLILILLIANLIFAPNHILTFKIANLPDDLENIENYTYEKNKFIKIDQLFSSFFDDSKNLKNTIKYNSYIRHKKYHNKNKFEIFTSQTLNIDSLISDLNTYINHNETIKEILALELISKKDQTINPYIYFIQIFIILLFLYLFKNIHNDKRK